MDYLQYPIAFYTWIAVLVVLNLIINGLPSIHKRIKAFIKKKFEGFKPYYKWITFNTYKILEWGFPLRSFKPYYKWITFNTASTILEIAIQNGFVLNLIINGLPSILMVQFVILTMIF